MSGLVAHASNAEWWLLSQERTALFRKGGASGQAIIHRQAQPKTVFGERLLDACHTERQIGQGRPV
ncbi:hypothetical protein [Solibacillus sp. FSL K6-1523]|uniref:hypothetical protein n=1 Tax=Solibacillus sp. FSL K6-1523 TaxID=2921471 RepID=UPI0030F98A81